MRVKNNYWVRPHFRDGIISWRKKLKAQKFPSPVTNPSNKSILEGLKLCRSYVFTHPWKLWRIINVKISTSWKWEKPLPWGWEVLKWQSLCTWFRLTQCLTLPSCTDETKKWLEGRAWAVRKGDVSYAGVSGGWLCVFLWEHICYFFVVSRSLTSSQLLLFCHDFVY